MPLDKNKREIRLLKLHPEEGDDSQIRCSIITTSLDHRPEYAGLSYCWGDASNPLTIKLNDAALSVTSNLHSALRQLSQHGLVSLLWVDAICINQHDIHERNHQITLMRDIYEGAQLTIVWLGEAADDSGLAIQLINAWANWYKGFDGFLQKFPFAFDEKMWAAANKFIQRPWWMRVWVYQEFLLSKEVMFACGSELLFNDFLKLAWEAWNEFPESEDAKEVSGEDLFRLVFPGARQIGRFQLQHLMREHHRTCTERGEPPHDDVPLMGLLELLSITRHMEATDPKDKLYALLGVDEIQDIPVQPNYTHSVNKVYTDFAVNWIRIRSSLDILVDAGIGIPKRDLQLPSWVPDHRKLGMFSKGEDFISRDHRASGDWKPNPRIDDSDLLLSVSGFICDVVTSMHEPSKRLDQRTEQWANLALGYTSTHPTGLPRLQVFFRTMIADVSGYGFGRPEFKNEQDWKEFVDLARGFMAFSGSRSTIYIEKNSSGLHFNEKCLRWWLAHDLDNSSHARFLQMFLKLVPDEPVAKTDRELLQPFLRPTSQHTEIPWPHNDKKPTFGEDMQSAVRYVLRAESSTMRKTFFVTDKGYMGFGPGKLCEGDLVCIIFGCPHPLLLRETGDTYHLVGEVYIYGMMRGEMMVDFEAGKFVEETFVLQ